MSQQYQCLEEEEEEDEEKSPCLGVRPKRSSPWQNLKLLGGRLSSSPDRYHKSTPNRSTSSPWAAFKKSLSTSLKVRNNSGDSGFNSHTERASISSNSPHTSNTYGSIPDYLWTDWRDAVDKTSSSSSSDTSTADNSLCDAFSKPSPIQNAQSPKLLCQPNVLLAPAKMKSPSSMPNSHRSQVIDLSDSVKKLEQGLDVNIPLLVPPPQYRRHTICVDHSNVMEDLTLEIGADKQRSKSDSVYERQAWGLGGPNQGSATNLFIITERSHVQSESICDENDEVNNDDDDEIAMFMRPMLPKEESNIHKHENKTPVKKLLKDLALEASDCLQPLASPPFASTYLTQNSSQHSEEGHSEFCSESTTRRNDIVQAKAGLKKTNQASSTNRRIPNLFADEIRVKSNVRRCNELLELLGHLKEYIPCESEDEHSPLFSEEEPRVRSADTTHPTEEAKESVGIPGRNKKKLSQEINSLAT